MTYPVVVVVVICGMLAMFLLLFVGQVKRGHLLFRRLLLLFLYNPHLV